MLFLSKEMKKSVKNEIALHGEEEDGHLVTNQDQTFDQR